MNAADHGQGAVEYQRKSQLAKKVAMYDLSMPLYVLLVMLTWMVLSIEQDY